MKLYDRLNEIEKEHELTKDLKLRVKCTDGHSFDGYFDGYTDALDNEPEITQLELRRFQDYPGTVSVFETEIESVEVIE